MTSIASDKLWGAKMDNIAFQKYIFSKLQMFALIQKYMDQT